MILVIDNYDSFVYNIVQYVGEHDVEQKVVRNDELAVEEIRALNPEAIIVSPGPGAPKDAGVSKDVIRQLGAEIPILGVCLGHQCIGETFGGSIVRAHEPMHGKTSTIHHYATGLLAHVPNPMVATRYHSLVIEPSSLPDCLELIAWTAKDEIMGVKHKEYPIYGLQFHPESILTEHGKTVISNFLHLMRAFRASDAA